MNRHPPPRTSRWRLFLFPVIFLVSNTCQDAPRKNPVDPGNPESEAIAPPIVQWNDPVQINMGFKLSWSKIDSTIPGDFGYHLVRMDSVVDKILTPETSEYIDTQFEASDSGLTFEYYISGRHLITAKDFLEGGESVPLSIILIAQPLSINIHITSASPPGLTNKETVDFEITTTTEQDPDSIRVSESPSFAGASWEAFRNPYTFALSPGDGIKKLYVECKDITNQRSNTAVDSVLLDTHQPDELGLTIIPVNNPLYLSAYRDEIIGFTPSRSVRLKLEAKDSTKWRAALNNETSTFPDNPPYTDYTSKDTLSWPWTLATGPSSPVVYAKFEDEVGNVESVNLPEATIEIDNIRPDDGASIVIADGNAETETEIVTLSLTNHDPNIFLMNISNSPSFPSENWLPFNKLIQDWQLPSGNGHDTRAVYVKFRDKAGNISSQYYSDEITLNPPPSVPGGLEVDSVANSTVWLSWNPNTENDLKNYAIYRSEGGGEPDSIKATTLTKYTDSDLQNETVYEYYLVAVDETDKKSPLSGGVQTTPINLPPTPNLVFAPSTGSRQTAFTFDVSGSSDDATPSSELQARWDFDGDGFWENTFSSEHLIVSGHQFADTGSVTVILEVRDEESMSALLDTTVYINRPPSPPIITSPPGPLYRNTQVTFTASGEDPDGASSSLSYRWIANGDTSAWGEPDVQEHVIQSDVLSQINVKVQSKDVWGDVSPWSNTSTIEIENEIPVPRVVISPGEGNRDTFFSFNASSSTDEWTPSEELQVSWDFGGDGIPEYGFSTENQLVELFQFSETGDISVVLEVRDGDLGVGRLDTTIHINIPPPVPSISIPPSPFHRNAQILITALSADPDDSPGELEYRWILQGDTLAWGESGVAGLPLQQQDTLGSISFKAQSRDSWEELSPWSNTSIIEIVNKVPVAGFNIAPPSGVGERDDVFQFTTNSDLSNDEYTPFDSLLFEWRFSAEGNWTAPDTVKSITHSYSEESAFVFDVSLRVTDSEGSSTATTRQVRINQPPSDPTLLVSTTSTYKNETITFTAVTSDPEGDPLEYYFDFGDEFSGWVSFSQLPHSYENSGSYDARVLVRDSWGDSSSWSPSRPITIDNRPPNTPSNITVTPTTIYAGDVITVRASVSDDDNDDVKLFIVWESNNVESSDYVSSGSFVSLTNAFASSGTRTISLYAQDTEGEQSTETNVTLNVYTETITKPGTPSGTSTGYAYNSYSYSTSGAISNAGHSLQYRFHWGDGTTSSWSTSLSASHTWSEANTYSVTVEARCATHTDVVSTQSNILSVTIYPETITTPGRPSGPSSGYTNTSYTFSTSGASSNIGHSLQYRFQWGDGNTSSWSSSLSASHLWSNQGSYQITVEARCATHTNVLSGQSNIKTVTINPETITTPGTPSGPSSGYTNTSYNYSTSGASSNIGHSLQYRFQWGDGNTSSWSSSLSASHSWGNQGSYPVQVEARCATHTNRVSSLSNSRYITISISTTTLRVTFDYIEVIDDGDLTGAGEFYWTFQLVNAPSGTVPLHQITRDGAIQASSGSIINVGASRTFSKNNTSGSSFNVILQFWESDAFQDDTLLPNPYSETYNYSGNWPTGPDSTLLTGDEAQIWVYWRID